MPLVERALQVLERREVRPQLGLLKSTMLQLDSTFSERAYGAGSFSELCRELEERAKSGELDGAGELADRIERELAALEEALAPLRLGSVS